MKIEITQFQLGHQATSNNNYLSQTVEPVVQT